MPESNIHYTIDVEQQRVLGHASGIIDFKDFDLHMQALAKDPEFYSGIFGLYDFSDVEKIQGDPSFFESTSEQITNRELIHDHAKVAIVTGGRKNLEAIFHGWKVMMNATLVSYETFATKEEANAWLALPYKVV